MRLIQTIRCLIAATMLLTLASAITLAHFVTPTCGAVTFNDTNTGWTAVVQPGDLVFGPFAHDGDSGPYKIAPGSYTYTFVDTNAKSQETGEFIVAPCASSSPSTVPSATPHRSPSATPPATDQIDTPMTVMNNYGVEATFVGFGAFLTIVVVTYMFLDRRKE